jgi:hypothetical protein
MTEVLFEELMEESVKFIEKDFYDKKFYFSYSSLNKLLYSPAVFYQLYVMGMKEERLDTHLVQGKIIHALLLEEEKFKDQFVVSPANLPTGTLRTVIDKVHAQFQNNRASYDALGVEKLSDLQDEILDVMKDINYHQSLKTDQQRLDKVLSTETENCFQFLKSKGSKVLIDQETFEFCKNAVDLIKTNKQICQLIGTNSTEFDNLEVINECFFQSDLANRSFGLKGIIDNIVIDHDNKIIYVNDIKTTSKDLKDFAESVEYYSYWMQAAVYSILVALQYGDLLKNGYNYKFHFVVIDRFFQTYAYPVKETTLNSWMERFKETLDIADWHYTNRSFELPYQFAKGLAAL